MPICDICSKPLNKAEMKIVPGRDVTAATARGFVPHNLGAHSPTKALGSLFGSSGGLDNDTWKFIVSQNSTTDWGLCSSCADELEGSQKKRPWWRFWG